VTVERIARNLAGWHQVSLDALGAPNERTADAWWTATDVAPIFLRWVTLRDTGAGTADAATLSTFAATALASTRRFVGISDPWARLDLAPHGFKRGHDEPWMERPASPVDDAVPATLRIVRVSDEGTLREFERVSAVGFGVPVPEPFTWHAPPLLHEPRFRMLLGYEGDRAVSASIGFAEAGVVGIYGVATIPDARGRGYGAALTRHTLLADPSRPAILQPSVLAEPMYARLGFRRIATVGSWHREAQA
jgi:ribosomal protein S18 acetylase RimI-like enzyme